MNKSIRKSKCFFFTLFYPYTHQGVSYDAYVYSEVKKLSKSFDEVHIVSIGQEHDGHTEIPPNVTFSSFSCPVSIYDKLCCVKFLFSAVFWNELRQLKINYSGGINLSKIKAVILFLIKADKYKHYLNTQFSAINFGVTDVVIYNYWTFENALAAVLLKMKYPVKVYTRMHSLDLYFDRVPENYLPFRKTIYNSCDAVFFISEQGRRYFNDIHKIEKQHQGIGIVNRIGVINNDTFMVPCFDKIILLSNAWVQPLKRIELIIESLALINEIKIEWIHIGDDYGTGRFEALKKYANQLLNEKSNISYAFAGRKNQQEVYKIFRERQVNLFINVSTTEGTPVSIMEALSFGVPVIATKVGGVPEIIEDGINGFLLPSTPTAVEVVDKIFKFNNLDKEAKTKMAINAYDIWNEKFNADKNSDELLRKFK